MAKHVPEQYRRERPASPRERPASPRERHASPRERHSLAELVTSIGAELMPVTAGTLAAAAQDVLHQLVDYFGVDLSFLRRREDDAGTTSLLAQWPVGQRVPDPSALGEGAVIVPLRHDDVTTGVLGFLDAGQRDWTPAELNALTAIASLMAALQARVGAEERLVHLAYHDELTGLPNRRLLQERLAELLAPGRLGPIAVLFLDLDRLKTMNDFLGHAAGDDFLRSLATRLRTGVRETDFVARLGGDEFIVVLDPTGDVQDARETAARMLAVSNQPVLVGGQEVSRGVSIGVAVAAPGASTASDLLRDADQAAMRAKASGGNEIVVFTDEMRTVHRERADVEMHLRTAIADDSLVLHYQPEIDLRDGRLVGLEALVRWRHPTRGLLQPDSFIGVAEATNLAGELGRWVIGEACHQLAHWGTSASERGLVVRVNVSPAYLVSVDFVAAVDRALRAAGIDGRTLCLEITEHAMVRDQNRALRTVAGLKELGVQIAIDDFGTGYSSLAQLKSLPVDALKIDRDFVRDLGDSEDDLAIVQSIVHLAEAFDLSLVAEGVQTPRAARTLVGLGCFRAQGFLIGRPRPADELGALIARGCVDLTPLGLTRQRGRDVPGGSPRRALGWGS